MNALELPPSSSRNAVVQYDLEVIFDCESAVDQEKRASVYNFMHFLVV